MVIEISLSRALDFSKNNMFVEIVDEKPCNVSIFYLSTAHNFNHHKKEGYYYQFKFSDIVALNYI